MWRTMWILPVALALVCSCRSDNAPSASGVQADNMIQAKAALKVTSTAFKDGGMIPKQYSCDSTGMSPPLSWSGAPVGTKSFALIVDDPDAPVGTYIHWVVWNIPANAKGIAENAPNAATMPAGSVQGVNSAKKIGWVPPCPPSGTHRYYFKLYALDTKLKLPASTDKQGLLKAMKGHVLAEGQIMGRYERS